MSHSEFMGEALILAKNAEKHGDVPVGAVIVCDGKIVAKAYNDRESSQQAINHAEILAIKKACKKLHSWRLNNCEMYVTLEPCSMCAGAMIGSRLKKVYIGTMDQKTGAVGSVLNLFNNVLNFSFEKSFNIIISPFIFD